MAAGSIAAPTIVPLKKPGKQKKAFSSATLIELSTDAADIKIFYTIDGSKPEPFRKIGTNNTYIYKKPFQLPAGKRSVRAVAVSSDTTRQSSIVTKTFVVEQANEQEELAERERLSGARVVTKVSKSLLGKILSSTSEPKTDRYDGNELIGRTRDLKLQHHTGPKHLSNRYEKDSSSMNQDYSKTLLQSTDSATQASKLLKQASHLHCRYCNAPRPSDPFARFCNECGAPIPPLPNTRLPPAEEGQLSVCVHCNSMVPLNAQKCIICEASIPQQKQAQRNVTGKEKQICINCGTVNPAGLDICVTCETDLNVVSQPIHTSTSAPPVPSKEGCLLQCVKCSRINNSDARFCDWCGAKPKQNAAFLTCSKCQASCHPYAKFCNTCGCLLQPPERLDTRNSLLDTKTSKALQTTSKSQDGNQWMPLNLPPSLPRMKSVQTQTQGLFYPSNKSLNNQKSTNSKETTNKDRRLPLSSVSPGKGFWRRQMDHVCGYLRVHVQNNAEFRKIIGEPRLGKLLAATIHEDIEDLTISVTYEVKQDKKTEVNKIKGGLSSFTEEEGKDILSQDKGTKKDGLSSGTKKKATKAKGFSFNKKETLSVENRILFKEIGKDGEGRPEEVQHLIEDGADANCKNSEQIPVLAVAMQNRHFDCMPILIQYGADINAKISSKGDTILHLAVQLGAGGVKAVELLLEYDVALNVKNGAGETPYDIAVKTSNDKVVSLIAAHSGKSLLNNLVKVS